MDKLCYLRLSHAHYLTFPYNLLKPSKFLAPTHNIRFSSQYTKTFGEKSKFNINFTLKFSLPSLMETSFRTKKKNISQIQSLYVPLQGTLTDKWTVRVVLSVAWVMQQQFVARTALCVNRPAGKAWRGEMSAEAHYMDDVRCWQEFHFDEAAYHISLLFTNTAICVCITITLYPLPAPLVSSPDIDNAAFRLSDQNFFTKCCNFVWQLT